MEALGFGRLAPNAKMSVGITFDLVMGQDFFLVLTKWRFKIKSSIWGWGSTWEKKKEITLAFQTNHELQLFTYIKNLRNVTNDTF